MHLIEEITSNNQCMYWNFGRNSRGTTVCRWCKWPATRCCIWTARFPASVLAATCSTVTGTDEICVPDRPPGRTMSAHDSWTFLCGLCAECSTSVSPYSR